MSILQRTKRRFLFVCLIASALMLTFSWHLLWQSYNPAIIKQNKVVNVESNVPIGSVYHTNVSEISIDNAYNSHHHNEFINKKKIQSTIIRVSQENINSSSQLPTDQLHTLTNLSTILPKDLKETLTRAHNIMEKLKTGLSLNMNDLEFLGDLKKQLNKIPLNSSNKTTSAPHSLPNNWQKYNYLTKNINKTLDSTQKILQNITAATPQDFKNLEIDKHSLSNHIKSGFQQDNRYINRINPDSSKNTTKNIRQLSDISMEDLQDTWNKMKNNRPYGKENNKFNPAVFLPDSDPDTGETSSDRPDFCRSCFSYEFPIIINQQQLCKTDKTIRLLMFISSAPNKREARVVLRKTWAAKCKEQDSNMKCLFVIGRSEVDADNQNIITENKTYGDILQIDFRDSYGNLTYKTITSFRWAAKFCSKAKYVMKTDDDMYVNTNLIPTMLEVAPTKHFAGGFCWGSSSPNRDLSSKWFVSFKMYRKQRFPPMCSGTGYILGMDVVRKILAASHNIPFFHLEDVYVSLCLQRYGIMPLNILGFNNMYTEFEACRYRNSVMTSHQFPTKMLEDFWPVIQACPAKSVSPTDLYIVIPYPITD
ncbi:hypothetical protein SNE40_007076 [Patella caerulea]|uniref:Uncharacterized protein n=1 Tax=Patella caerulea TaxID=87958 RepID=A0AAN8JY37_PATCE